MSNNWSLSASISITVAVCVWYQLVQCEWIGCERYCKIMTVTQMKVVQGQHHLLKVVQGQHYLYQLKTRLQLFVSE